MTRNLPKNVVLCAAFVTSACLATPAFAQETMTQDDPIAGISDGGAFLRSRDNSLVLMPNGRLQVDYYGYARPTADMPNNTLLLRRARLELAGWVGPWFFFNL